MGDLEQLDACQLAHLLRTSELSPFELTSQTIAHIKAKEPHLNALTNNCFEEALERAKNPLPIGTFAGIPWLMKDLVDTPYLPRSNGSHFALEQNNKQFSNFVKAAKTSGFNLLAMTNTPEFGCSVHTNNIRFGETKNPWSDTSPAGSSGGSAVAVAAGGGHGGRWSCQVQPLPRLPQPLLSFCRGRPEVAVLSLLLCQHRRRALFLPAWAVRFPHGSP